MSELAGQLQSQKGRVESARGRLANIDSELAQIAQFNEDGNAQTREAREKLETAISRMAELQDARQGLETERRTLAEARDGARDRARESRETAHALALTVETQRTQVASLAQALSRMGQQRGQLDTRLGELAAQLSDGDDPVKALQAERQSALDELSLIHI